jgi:hypothetical protein
MPKINFSIELLEQFNLNTPKIRGFYKHKNSKWQNETKDKYKICYKEIEKLNLFSFLISTSKNHWYTEYFEFKKTDINDLINQPWLKDVWYINIWNNNELFDFKTKDEFSNLYIKRDIEKIWLLNNTKYTELKKVIDNSKKAKTNYIQCYSTLIQDIEDEFINKYKV